MDEHFLIRHLARKLPMIAQTCEQSKLSFQILTEECISSTSNIEPGRKGLGLFVTLFFSCLPNLGLLLSLTRVKLRVDHKEPVDVVHSSGTDRRVE